MSFTVYTYLLYLAISIALTVWVARTLHKNGRVFLVDVFRGNTELADSVNPASIWSTWDTWLWRCASATTWGAHRC